MPYESIWTGRRKHMTDRNLSAIIFASTNKCRRKVSMWTNSSRGKHGDAIKKSWWLLGHATSLHTKYYPP